MKKQDFIQELSHALTPIDAQTRAEIIADINEHFAEGTARGLSEEEICRNLGQPGQIAEQVLEEYNEVQRSMGSNNFSDPPQPPQPPPLDFAGIGETITAALEHADIAGTVNRALKSAGINGYSNNGRHGRRERRERHDWHEMRNSHKHHHRHDHHDQHVEIDETFPGVAAIEADLIMANIYFYNDQQLSDVRVVIHGRNRFNEINMENKNGTLHIKQSGPVIRFGFFRLKPNLEVTVYLPSSFTGDIKASTATGSIQSAGITSRVELDTAAGGISLDDFNGKYAKLDSGAGSISVSGNTIGDIRADTGAGKINIQCQEAREVKLGSGAGSMEVYAGKLTGDIKMSTGAASIRLEAHDVLGNISASTGAGSIRMYLPQYTNHRIKAEKPGIGSLTNQLIGNPDSPYTLRASSGAGSITLAALEGQAAQGHRPYQ